MEVGITIYHLMCQRVDVTVSLYWGDSCTAPFNSLCTGLSADAKNLKFRNRMCQPKKLGAELAPGAQRTHTEHSFEPDSAGTRGRKARELLAAKGLEASNDRELLAAKGLEASIDPG